MGTVTVTSAILIVTAWTALIEFDSYSEEKRVEVIRKIKSSPRYFIIIALLPVGILVNILGTVFRSFPMVLAGASLIFIFGIMVAAIFWNRVRWKSIMLFILVIGLGIFLYVPLFFA